MSVPALRQPKNSHVEVAAKAPPPATNTELQNYLIVTLRDGKKLVVSSDSYHGLLTAGELFRCVFCETEMVRDVICKERHKTSENHRKILESYPHVEEFKENLIRKVLCYLICPLHSPRNQVAKFQLDDVVRVIFASQVLPHCYALIVHVANIYFNAPEKTVMLSGRSLSIEKEFLPKITAFRKTKLFRKRKAAQQWAKSGCVDDEEFNFN